MLQRKLMSFPTALDLSGKDFRKGPLVPVHRSAGDPSSQFAHCHDGVRMTMMVAPMKIYDDENHGDDDTN